MKEKLGNIIISIGLFIVGLCLLLWAEKVTNLVSIFFGCLMILCGIFTAVSYVTSDSKKTTDILYTIILLIVGVILVSKPSILSEFISFIIGIYVILSSLAGIKFALDYKDSSNYNLTLGLSVTGLIIGILCIIGKLLIPNIILQFVGVLLIIYGIINIINSLITLDK